MASGRRALPTHWDLPNRLRPPEAFAGGRQLQPLDPALEATVAASAGVALIVRLAGQWLLVM